MELDGGKWVTIHWIVAGTVIWFWNWKRSIVWQFSMLIYLKTNMEPENHPFDKENHLPSVHFWGSMLVFGSVIYLRVYQKHIKHWIMTDLAQPQSSYNHMPRTISGDLFRFHLVDANNSRITFINNFYILNMIGLTNAWIHISIWGAAQPLRQVSLGCQCHQDGIRAFPKVTLHFPHWNPGATCIPSSREKNPGIPHSQSSIFRKVWE